VSQNLGTRGCVVLADNQPHVRMDEQALATLANSSDLVRLEFGYAREELFRALVGADVVISIHAPITADMMDAASRLKSIVIFGVGYDHVDVAAATDRGITVSNTRGANAEAVAELAFSMMMNLVRRTCQADSLVRAGKWRPGSALPSWLCGRQLWEKTVGIVGLGNIGRRVARIAAGFDMSILAYDPYVPAAVAQRLGARLVDLQTVFREADVVTIHIPLSADTEGLVNTDRLALMKSTAYLINTSRGAIVDEKALLQALAEGRIAGAGLDVFCVEPLPSNHPLLSFDNVILSAHIGGFTAETMEAASASIVRRVQQVLAGEVPDCLVNEAALKGR